MQKSNMHHRLPENLDTEEFLEWVAMQPGNHRYELFSGRVVEMAAERNRHSIVKLEVAAALLSAVKRSGAACTVLGDGATVVAGERDAFEPDVTVQCGIEIDEDAVTVPFPIVVVEVLSPSTQSIDEGSKLSAYLAMPSVKHYLIVDALKQLIVHHRKEDDGIVTSIVTDGGLVLEPPGLTLPVSACFTQLNDAS